MAQILCLVKRKENCTKSLSVSSKHVTWSSPYFCTHYHSLLRRKHEASIRQLPKPWALEEFLIHIFINGLEGIALQLQLSDINSMPVFLTRNIHTVIGLVTGLCLVTYGHYH